MSIIYMILYLKGDFMLKGINRRIIEINKTNNDYFEKAILFVKSEKIGLPQQTLANEANLFLKDLQQSEKKNVNKMRLVSYILVAILSLVVIATIIYSVFNL